MITASTDAVVLDAATAAAINFQNRDEEENQEEEDDLSIAGQSEDAAARSITAEWPPTVPGLMQLARTLGAKGGAASTDSVKDTASVKRKTMAPEDAWKKFSMNMRKVRGREPRPTTQIIV